MTPQSLAERPQLLLQGPRQLRLRFRSTYPPSGGNFTCGLAGGLQFAGLAASSLHHAPPGSRGTSHPCPAQHLLNWCYPRNTSSLAGVWCLLVGPR